MRFLDEIPRIHFCSFNLSSWCSTTLASSSRTIASITLLPLDCKSFFNIAFSTEFTDLSTDAHHLSICSLSLTLVCFPRKTPLDLSESTQLDVKFHQSRVLLPLHLRTVLYGLAIFRRRRIVCQLEGFCLTCTWHRN
jgi:hypothetical protein